MPTLREIESALCQLAPKESAMEGDNVGFLIGRPDREATRILVALDVTEDVAMEAAEWGANLIVAHHPVMNCAWSPVQDIRDDKPQGRLFLKLIENGIAAICMHTNLDRAGGGVNDALAARLGLEQVEKLPGGDDVLRVGVLPGEMALPDFLQWVKAAISPNGIRFADGGKPIRRVAVGGGACGGYLWAAAENGCDAFVTSDLKYNQFMDARDLGLTVLDAGHFPTEDVVCPVLVKYLEETFPRVKIKKSAMHKEAVQYYV
ncbi:MAG: Nif3-like dinuclear metal center hexameric protein [Oscillospiraceae bacterium]|nr:Nif3-like dinuclear metal center hexameric protein [Oscillospiraceae bacterium]